MNRDDMTQAMREGAREGVNVWYAERMIKEASEGKLSIWAYEKQDKIRRKMRLRSHIAWILALISWGLSTYLFISGNVLGGFGVFFSVVVWGIAASLTRTLVDNAKLKDLWAAAYESAAKDIKKHS